MNHTGNLDLPSRNHFALVRDAAANGAVDPPNATASTAGPTSPRRVNASASDCFALHTRPDTSKPPAQPLRGFALPHALNHAHHERNSQRLRQPVDLFVRDRLPSIPRGGVDRLALFRNRRRPLVPLAA